MPTAWNMKLMWKLQIMSGVARQFILRNTAPMETVCASSINILMDVWAKSSKTSTQSSAKPMLLRLAFFTASFIRAKFFEA